jgi:hypothetical protein
MFLDFTIGASHILEITSVTEQAPVKDRLVLWCIPVLVRHDFRKQPLFFLLLVILAVNFVYFGIVSLISSSPRFVR